MKQYISSEIIPVSYFHISGRQVIGLKFSTEFSFAGFIWHSTVLPYFIQDGISVIPSSISFNWVAILSCNLSSLLPKSLKLHHIRVLSSLAFCCIVSSLYLHSAPHSAVLVSQFPFSDHSTNQPLYLLFLYTPYSTPKCPTFFSIWYISIITPYLSIELVVNFLLFHIEQSITPVLLYPFPYRVLFADLARLLCFNSSITCANPFLCTLYFSSTSLALPSLCAPICPFFTLSRKLISFMAVLYLLQYVVSAMDPSSFHPHTF